MMTRLISGITSLFLRKASKLPLSGVFVKLVFRSVSIPSEGEVTVPGDLRNTLWCRVARRVYGEQGLEPAVDYLRRGTVRSDLGVADIVDSKTSLTEQVASVTIIEPSRGWVSLRLRELWEYRELVYFLTWRDIKVRYKQTVLGAAWAIIQPFFTMVIFTLFFGRLAKVPSDGVPYPIFSFAALVPWTFFANGLTQASNSLVGSANLITKVYFPRFAVPLSSVASGAVDFILAFLILIGMMLVYSVIPGLKVLWLPLFLLLALTTSLGVGLWLSALNVKYRDVRYVVPFLTQVWMFASPIAYPSSLLSEPWRTVYGINPMVGVVEGFRWALLGTGKTPGPMIIISSFTAATILVSGAFYFRSVERTFADVV